MLSVAGDIHIWDRSSGYLLHSFQAQDLDNDLTCIAWNHAASPFMFTTGSHDGTVRVWTSVASLPPRSSYQDLRQGGSGTITPPPMSHNLHPAFALDIVDRTRSPGLHTISGAGSRTPSIRSSFEGRAPSVERRSGNALSVNAPSFH